MRDHLSYPRALSRRKNDRLPRHLLLTGGKRRYYESLMRTLKANRPSAARKRSCGDIARRCGVE